MSNTAAENANSSLQALRALELKLLAIDPSDLDDAAKSKLADDLNSCTLNINKLQAADFNNLNAEFEAQSTALEAAASKLNSDANGLNNAVDIVNTVSTGLDTVTGIVNLLKQ